MKDTKNHADHLVLRRKIAAKLGAGMTTGIVLGAAIGRITQMNIAIGLTLGIIVGGSGAAVYIWKTSRKSRL